MKLVHPTDFSQCAEQARDVAVDLARKLDGELVLLHVLVETPLYGEGVLSVSRVREVYEAQRRWAEEALEARVADLRQHGIKASHRVEMGVPFETIVQIAGEERADMIVMGTGGRTGLDRILVGSVAERVIRTAQCPVLTVRPTKGEAGR